MDEYPKVIDCGGVKVTVTDAADEARWTTASVVMSPVEPLEPVFVPTVDSVEIVGLTSPDTPPDETVESDPTPKKKAKTPKKK